MSVKIKLPVVDFPQLEESTTAEMQELAEELVDAYEKRQQWRTEIEMRFSVLNDAKFPTPASKYWQAVREQSVFYAGVVSGAFEYRREQITNERLQARLTDASGLDADEIQVDLDESDWNLANLALEGRDRVREIRLWSEIKAECVKSDPKFNTENPNDHQFTSLHEQLLHRSASLTPHNSQAERLNVMGPLMTFDKVKGTESVAS